MVLLQVGASLYGASAFEKASVVAGKAVHYMLLFGLPWILHGPAAALIGAASYYATQVIIPPPPLGLLQDCLMQLMQGPWDRCTVLLIMAPHLHCTA